jgi:hypothetical protein
VTRVLVNGQPAESRATNFAEWEITLKTLLKPEAPAKESDAAITAVSADAAGNVEPRPHVLPWKDQ